MPLPLICPKRIGNRESKAVIIGLAGHVDHGKSALVAALTGGTTDRLPEERRRGMTITLGYAFAPGLAFVDVPGHERFVATMAAGAAGIDAALLAIAADEGVMPQTEEHVAILAYLGIAAGVVALTRADLAPECVPAAAEAVAALLARHGLGPFPTVAVSALTGFGIERLAATLRALPARPRRSDGPARLAVDRVFVLKGTGVVATGTLLAGAIAPGDTLMLSPAGRTLRVRGLHAENRPAERATSGQRVALNLAGPRLEAAHIRRGDFLCNPALHHPAEALDVQLLGPEPNGGAAIGAGGDRQVQLLLAAAHLSARLLPAPAHGLARLIPEHPIPALAGDRFVLRDPGGLRTLGGGIVLDPFPPRRGRLAPARLKALSTLAEAPSGGELTALLAAPPGFVDLGAFERAWGLSSAEAAARADACGAVRHGGIAFTPECAARLTTSILDSLAAVHTADPEAAGIAPTALRRHLPEPPPAAVLTAMVNVLANEGQLVWRGSMACLPSHRPRLAPDTARLAEALRPHLSAEPWQPPRLRALSRLLGIEESPLRAKLHRLCRAGTLVELAPDRFFLAEHSGELAALAAEIAAGNEAGVVDTARFRDRSRLGRKLAVEILEGFDRLGITVREGEVRRLLQTPDLVTPSDSASHGSARRPGEG